MTIPYTNFMIRGTALFVSAFLLFFATLPAAAQFEGAFNAVGGPFPHVQSAASATSADGLVVIGTSAAEDGIEEAFRWDAFQRELLGTLPGGGESTSRDVSPDGSVVVGHGTLSNGLFEAFRWTEEEEMEGLGFLHSGDAFSEAFAVSADGSVVVGDGSSDNGIIEAFRWTEAGGMEGLGDLPGGSFSSRAFDVSDDGNVIVGRGESDDGDEAFIWTEEEGMQPLFVGGAFEFSTARATSADGSVVVGHTSSSSPDRTEAFRFEPGDRDDLGDLPGGEFFSVALDVSPDGSIVVGQSDSDVGLEAFIWTAFHGMRSLKSVLEEVYNLDLTGWTLRSAEGISVSDRGFTTIVGSGVNPDGVEEGWRAALPRFPGVGDRPGGGFLSTVLGISADGSVVVGRGTISEFNSEAFRWTEEGGMVGLGALGDFIDSEAEAVSANGSVVVGESQAASGFGDEAFRWTEDEGMIGLGDLPGGNDFPFSQARAVSADGAVVVGRGDSDDGFEAFRWEDGDIEGLGDLSGGGFDSRANGVSADGSVVVGRGLSEDGLEAFRWTETVGMVGLGDLPGGSFSSTADAVSADGSVVVGGSSSENGFEAFRWTEDGGMVGLGDLPGGIFSSSANAVSADGSIVVGESDSENGNPFGTEAFIWTEDEGMQSVKELVEEEYGAAFDGWVFAEATGVGVAGGDTIVVAGIGMNPLGLQEGFRVPLTVIGPVANEPTPGEAADILSRPTPNPASGLTTLRIGVERTQELTVAVFDALGRRVQTLFDGTLTAGKAETLTFDTSALPAGMYLIRATGEGFADTRRVTVMR